jgi:hypothetical protein
MFALASLPSLENVTLGSFAFGYEEASEFRGLRILMKPQSLRSIEFSQIHFTSGLTHALLAAFEAGSFVTDLKFFGCYLGGVVDMQTNTSLKRLTVNAFPLTDDSLCVMYYRRTEKRAA